MEKTAVKGLKQIVFKALPNSSQMYSTIYKSEMNNTVIVVGIIISTTYQYLQTISDIYL